MATQCVPLVADMFFCFALKEISCDVFSKNDYGCY